MSDLFDGGPAFPVVIPGNHISGMTKREWFAGQAMLGLYQMIAGRAHTVSASSPEADLARQAYLAADAMLEAGSEPQPVQYREMYADEKAKVEAADRLAEAVGAIQKVSAYLAIPQDLRGALERALEDVTEPVLPF